jgi:mannose-6-phosphate isomerase-like protein (cupin superfamily)
MSSNLEVKFGNGVEDTMRLLLITVFLTILVAEAVHAGDPDGFGMWKQSDFRAHEKVLEQKIQADHSARETLGDYGNHMIRMIHRVATGAPEFHAHTVDIWVVESGKGALVLGGKLVNPKPVGNGPQGEEMTGTGITGGESHEISAGDVIHIPANTPHWAVVPEGGAITYLRITVPSK